MSDKPCALEWILMAQGAMISLTSNTVAELADKTILTSKFSMSGRVGGDEDNVQEVEVEWEPDGILGMDRVR